MEKKWWSIKSDPLDPKGVSNSPNDNMLLLSQIPRGSSASQRVGNMVYIKSLYLNWSWPVDRGQPEDWYSWGQQNLFVRFIVFQWFDKEPPTWQKLFEYETYPSTIIPSQPNIVTAMYRRNYSGGRYRILRDKIQRVDTSILVTETAGNIRNWPMLVKFKIKRFKLRRMRWSEGSIPNIPYGALYFTYGFYSPGFNTWEGPSQKGPAYHIESRLTFVDA